MNLIALSSERPIDVTHMMLQFAAGVRWQNEGGWGAMIEDGFQPIVIRGIDKAADSDIFKACLDEMSEQRVSICGAAEKQLVNIMDCQPGIYNDSFGRTWYMANSVSVSPLLKSLKNGGDSINISDDDTVNVFRHLDDIMVRRSALRAYDTGERFRLLEETFNELSEYGPVSVIAYDGELLYGYTNVRDGIYLSALDDDDRTVWMSTVALSGINWKQLPMARLIALHKGRLMLSADTTGKEFREPVREVIS